MSDSLLADVQAASLSLTLSSEELELTGCMACAVSWEIPV